MDTDKTPPTTTGVEAIAADVAHRDARLLSILVRNLDQFLAPLGRQIGDRNSKKRAFDNGIETEVRLADRAVDGLDGRLVPDLD